MKPFVIFLPLFLLMYTITAQTRLNDNISDTDITPEVVVNRQLEAYNSRNIEQFVATYSENIEIYKDGKLIMKGREQLRERYDALFKNTPNLHCFIENRILINNKVIDKENVKTNDRFIEAVAIYEVADGKIQKVTFVE